MTVESDQLNTTYQHITHRKLTDSKNKHIYVIEHKTFPLLLKKSSIMCHDCYCLLIKCVHKISNENFFQVL